MLGQNPAGKDPTLLQAEEMMSFTSNPWFLLNQIWTLNTDLKLFLFCT